MNPKYSLKPVAAKAAELLGRPVAFATDCIGDAAKSVVDARTRGGGVVLLENLRFHPEEEKNDPEFAKQLASLTDLYVNDAFGAAHRAHASVDAITHHVPKAAAGLLMEKELEYLGRVLDVARSPAGGDSRRREGVGQARGDSEFSWRASIGSSSAARWRTRF